ncbi:MAG: FRG domain-containing protein [Treponemataceae bacterium]|nr:FRG domain-containing protein [Treponemataceae bacterium]
MKSKVEEKKFYFEHTIKLNDPQKSYLDLLEMFFKPEEFFNSNRFEQPLFDKIFPENPDYQNNHAEIARTRDFLAWNGWVFRGHRDSSWKLATTIDRRYADVNLLTKPPICLKGKSRMELERAIMREFSRKNYEYDVCRGMNNNMPVYEVIANMQHYGCATRFLDITFSFFVALFFACGNMEFREDNFGTFSIWCFNRMWIEKTYKKHLPQEIADLYKTDKFGKLSETQEAVFDYFFKHKELSAEEQKNTFKTVINMTPFEMNRRLIRQQGSFLMPTNPFVSFEENISNLVSCEDDKFRILKINVEYDNLTLVYLQKFLGEMNINHSVLFDDIDNLCTAINFKSHLPNDALVIDSSCRKEKNAHVKS